LTTINARPSIAKKSVFEIPHTKSMCGNPLMRLLSDWKSFYVNQLSASTISISGIAFTLSTPSCGFYSAAIRKIRLWITFYPIDSIIFESEGA
jgi:predicted phage gp36 major capsid-like protein